MTDEAALNRKAEEIGQRIRALMNRKNMDHKALGEALGITGNAVTKILGGSSTTQYAKLSNLADVLGVDPNEILGFAPGSSRELLLGALEGTMLGLQFPPVEAEEIALIVLRVLETPSSSHLSTASPRHTGKVIAEFLIRQHVDSKPSKPSKP
jgi:transcriptional regulator with XRE-family HTH domain